MIERIDFDSAQVPAARQFESWAGHAPYARLTALHPGPFRARGSLWKLHEAHITTAELDPFRTERDARLIERVEADQIHIVVLLRGSIRFEADGIDEVCVAPDVCVRDLTLPSRITAGPIECMTIYFTRDFLARAGGVAGRHGRLPFSPELAVARELLRSLVAHLPDTGVDSGAHYARALRNVVAAAIIAGWGPASERPDGAVALRIKRYIAAQPPGTLNVAAMTLALGISRAALYRMFRREGGIIAYDRQKRLRALYRAIAEPPHDRSIAKLAADHGFNDATVLSRLFRRTFGCAPGSLRRDGDARQADDPADRIGAAIAQLA